MTVSVSKEQAYYHPPTESVHSHDISIHVRFRRAIASLPTPAFREEFRRRDGGKGGENHCPNDSSVNIVYYFVVFESDSESFSRGGKLDRNIFGRSSSGMYSLSAARRMMALTACTRKLYSSGLSG